MRTQMLYSVKSGETILDAADMNVRATLDFLISRLCLRLWVVNLPPIVKSACGSLSTGTAWRATSRLLRISYLPPSPRCHNCPNCFYTPERPRSLKKPVGRPKQASSGKRQNKPRTAFLQGIG